MQTWLIWMKNKLKSINTSLDTVHRPWLKPIRRSRLTEKSFSRANAFKKLASQWRLSVSDALSVNVRRSCYCSLHTRVLISVGANECSCTHKFWGRLISHPLILRKSDFLPLIFVQKCLLSLDFWGNMKICTHTSEIPTRSLKRYCCWESL